VTTSPHFVTHDTPVWRERSTSVIRAKVPNPPDGQEWYEQLWARRIDATRYELCCVPFATYDYALGDIVEVGPEDSSTHMVRGVVERSGRTVLRAWLADASSGTWDELQGMLRFRHLLFEFRKPGLVAIDVASSEGQPDVEAELRKLEQSGRLRYERASEGYHLPPDK
jgi:hypothetical protein